MSFLNYKIVAVRPEIQDGNVCGAALLAGDLVEMRALLRIEDPRRSSFLRELASCSRLPEPDFVPLRSGGLLEGSPLPIMRSGGLAVRIPTNRGSNSLQIQALINALKFSLTPENLKLLDEFLMQDPFRALLSRQPGFDMEDYQFFVDGEGNKAPVVNVGKVIASLNEKGKSGPIDWVAELGFILGPRGGLILRRTSEDKVETMQGFLVGFIQSIIENPDMCELYLSFLERDYPLFRIEAQATDEFDEVSRAVSLKKALEHGSGLTEADKDKNKRILYGLPKGGFLSGWFPADGHISVDLTVYDGLSVGFFAELLDFSVDLKEGSLTLKEALRFLLTEGSDLTQAESLYNRDILERLGVDVLNPLDTAFLGEDSFSVDDSYEL
jgi:hypothetical protein